jgi:hypothetical protein
MDEKRTSELVRVYATNAANRKTTGYRTDPVSGDRAFFTINAPGEFHEERIGAPEASYFKTDSVAQAFMNTTGVVKFLGTTGGGGSIGAKYDVWGTYAVEMTPRVHWVHSAPFHAPMHPSPMEHFINVVTDSASAHRIFWGPAAQAPTNRFLFNRKIVGTGLVWGTMSVAAGTDFWIGGWDSLTGYPDASVRFSGFVYGFYTGHEEFRPGWTPAQYEEYLGAAYGYPLAPARRAGQTTSGQPILTASDLDFGIIDTSSTDTMKLRLCNAGTGTLIFDRPFGGDIITGLNDMFSIPQSEMSRLRNASLGANECIDIDVVFNGTSEPGIYTSRMIILSSAGPDTIRLWATVIAQSSSVESPMTTNGAALTSIDPNPLHRSTRIEFRLATAAATRLEIFDITGRIIATLVDERMQPGTHAVTWDASAVAAGTYYCRLTVDGRSRTQPLIVE